MTTLHEYRNRTQQAGKTTAERRRHRRHDLEQHGIKVDRWDGRRNETLGALVDLSSGGVRIRTKAANIRPDSQIRVRLELPDYAGICPFVDTTAETPQPKKEWVGWMSVARVQRSDDGKHDVAGRLVDMDEMDRGMLSLYLFTQPLAA